jgi:hypothetical protein
VKRIECERRIEFAVLPYRNIGKPRSSPCCCCCCCCCGFFFKKEKQFSHLLTADGGWWMLCAGPQEGEGAGLEELAKEQQRRRGEGLICHGDN